ncbi:MAG: FG-GAP repeat domain-containing protein [Verrucomicrobiaceae bacterium]
MRLILIITAFVTLVSNAREWTAAETESFQESARDQLGDIVELLREGNPEELADYLASPHSAVAGSLRPSSEHALLNSTNGGITTLRWEGSPDDTPRSLGLAFEELSSSWPKGGEPRLKVKNFDVRVQPGGKEIATSTDYDAFIQGTERSVQQIGKWRCLWQIADEPEAPPLLKSITLLELTETTSSRSGHLLKDVTLPVLGDLPAFQNILAKGANYWIPRLPRLKHRFQHGLAVGDLNGDGLEEIYLCQPEGIPNILLMRQPDGSVRDAAADYGLNFRDISTSALFADFDNDGDQDLVITFRSPIDFFENVGGKFIRRHSLPHRGQVFNLAAADYDSDGFLDLYVCQYQNLDELGRAPGAIPLHDAKNGGKNSLHRNLGNWKFEDVTTSVGLDQNNDRWTVAASWEDFDRDGDLDLYCANDYGRNNFYRCDTAKDGIISFTDIAPETGVEDMTTSMGISWGDPNRDGIPDIYVSNMYSSAGRRIAFQKDFKRNIAKSTTDHVKAWQHAAMGNSLFQGRADGSFVHASKVSRVYKGRWSWGTTFADLNHDGWDDLLVANGFITGIGTLPDL